MRFDRVPPIAKYLSLVFMLNGLGMSTVWMFLPIFFEKHIASVFLIGVITSLPSAIPILMDIPVGNLVQRAGEKTVIFLGLVAYIFPPLLFLTGLPIVLVFGKVFEGFAKSLLWNGGWSLSLRSSSAEAESESAAVFLLGFKMAMIIGPVVGGYIIMNEGFAVPFYLWIFTSLLAVMVFLSYIGLSKKHSFIESFETLFERKTYKDDYHHIRENWHNLKLPLSIIFVQSVIVSFFWLAVPLLLNQIGADYVTMGVIFGIAVIPGAFQFIFGEISDRIGKLKTMLMLSALLVPVLVAMSAMSSIYIIGVLFLVAQFFTSGITPAAHAFYDSRVPDELEGELTGWMELFKHLGQTLGPIMAGTISSIWSINASYLGAAAAAVAIMILTHRGIRVE